MSRSKIKQRREWLSVMDGCWNYRSRGQWGWAETRRLCRKALEKVSSKTCRYLGVGCLGRGNSKYKGLKPICKPLLLRGAYRWRSFRGKHDHWLLQIETYWEQHRKGKWQKLLSPTSFIYWREHWQSDQFCGLLKITGLLNIKFDSGPRSPEHQAWHLVIPAESTWRSCGLHSRTVWYCNTFVMLTIPRRFPSLRAKFPTRLPFLLRPATDLAPPGHWHFCPTGDKFRVSSITSNSIIH